MKTSRTGLLAALTMTVLAAVAVGCVTRVIVSTSVARFVYVANQNDNNVSSFTIDNTTGALTPGSGSPFPGVTGPRNVAVCLSGQLLYVANGNSNGVSGYKIDLSSGTLTPVPGSPFAGGSAPRGVAAHPGGNFIYVANSGDNTVSAYKINGATGTLTEVAGSPFPAGTGPFGITVDPSGRFVYAANHKSSSISGYSIDASTGALTPIAGSPFPDQFDDTTNTGPFEIALNLTGNFLYVTNHFTSDISGYSVDPSTGALNFLANAPYRAGNEPFGIIVAPSGQFVYVANRATANIFVYSLDPGTGALSQIVGSPYSVGSVGDCSPSPYELALDPSGRFLYVPNIGCRNISAFSVDPSTGELTLLPDSPFPAGNGPYGIAVSRLRLQ